MQGNEFEVEFRTKTPSGGWTKTVHAEGNVSDKDLVEVEAMMFGLLEARKKKGEALGK